MVMRVMEGERATRKEWTVSEVERLHHTVKAKWSALEVLEKRLKEMRVIKEDLDAEIAKVKECLENAKGKDVYMYGVRVSRDVAEKRLFQLEVQRGAVEKGIIRAERRAEKLKREIKRIEKELEEISKGKLVICGEEVVLDE